MLLVHGILSFSLMSLGSEEFMDFLNHSLSLLVWILTPEGFSNIDEYVGIWEIQKSYEPVLSEPSPLQRKVVFGLIS